MRLKPDAKSALFALTLFAGAALGGFLATWGVTTPRKAVAQATTTAASTGGTFPPTLYQASDHLAGIARRLTPSVVHIQSTVRKSNRTVEETGSGVIVHSPAASGTYVVTNWHVVDGADSADIAIRTFDGRVLHPLNILKDPESDVAVLKIDGDGLHAAPWGDSDAVRMGHMVLAVGSPFGLSQSMTMGIISAKSRRSLRLGNGKRRVLNQDFLQTDAAINPGNSGGPLIDLHGRVIGINAAIASNSGGNDGIGFSIPSNLVRRIMDHLLVSGRVPRAYLGVKLDADFNEQTARRLKIGRVRGARVIEVYGGTPAADAGLKFDDVVTRFNDTLVQDENHLINLVSLTHIGSSVQLTVVRDGRTIVLRVKLADREELVNRSPDRRE